MEAIMKRKIITDHQTNKFYAIEYDEDHPQTYNFLGNSQGYDTREEAEAQL